MTTKKAIILLFVGIIGISLTSCLLNISTKPCNDKTPRREERTVNKFSEINLATAADIQLTQGSPQKIEIEGPACDLENIQTTVSGSALSIHNEHNLSGNRDKTIIYITVENINSLSIAGSGSIVAKSDIRTNDLSLDIAGSGSIIIKGLNAVTVKSSIAGSGSIELSGNEKTEKHKIDIAGSGDIQAKNLPTSLVEVNIAGSGSCYLNVIEKLKASIMGSGDIYYLGNPQIESSSAGSGKIKPMQ